MYRYIIYVFPPIMRGGKATGIYILQGIYKDNVYRKKNMVTMSNPNSSLNVSVSLEECERQKLSFYSRIKSTERINEKS